MTYDESILCDIQPHNSQISTGDAFNLEASCMGNLSLSSSSQQRTIIQNVLHVPHLSASLLSVSRIT